MQISTTLDHTIARITMSGRFDFSSHRLFRDTYDEILENPDVTEIMIDLGAIEYLDSSALGMLLLLREKTGNAGKSMTLTNCHGVVRQVLEVANFNKLFTIR